MTPALPSIEPVAPGTTCPRCASRGYTVEIHVEGFCAECFERSMVQRERAIRADHERAKRRARMWQLGRAVQR